MLVRFLILLLLLFLLLYIWRQSQIRTQRGYQFTLQIFLESMKLETSKLKRILQLIQFHVLDRLLYRCHHHLRWCAWCLLLVRIIFRKIIIIKPISYRHVHHGQCLDDVIALGIRTQPQRLLQAVLGFFDAARGIVMQP